jgi:hypothetical protein
MKCLPLQTSFETPFVSFLRLEVKVLSEELSSVSLQNRVEYAVSKAKDHNPKLCESFSISVVRHNCLVIQAVVILQYMQNAMQFAIAENTFSYRRL